ncbi:ribosome maturation factor RimM [uncultured Paludibaculum sp.]|uniref:ribosome maturation factor RimM n=1 Tax=uncultured Paludibaculum sp. TaxID=1765020 RepID=UPI002AAB696A|nr:ribosome maturation factor RimM [uncultured Paludibaculum sp.]
MGSSAPVGPPVDWVLIGRLTSIHGLRGEVLVDGWNDVERYDEWPLVWLRDQSGGWAHDGMALRVETVRPHKGGLLVAFAGLDSIDDVEPLKGCELVIRKSDRPALPEGEYYMADLVGCAVFDRATGQKLGTVTGWQEFGGPELLEVSAEGAKPGEPVDSFSIPFARSICVDIDPAGRRIGVDLPEGLLELNRAAPKEPGSDR